MKPFSFEKCINVTSQKLKINRLKFESEFLKDWNIFSLKMEKTLSICFME